MNLKSDDRQTLLRSENPRDDTIASLGAPLEGGDDVETENGVQEEEEAPSNATINGVELFGSLSSELMEIVCQYIGKDDTKSIICLANTCHAMRPYIYNQCQFLWKTIDLYMFPGITTDVQVQALLETVNAVSVTESLLLNKCIDLPINGEGLEPLRGSRVLKRIDLRQTYSNQPGPTGLDDMLVTDILSTMLPHCLMVVKVRREEEEWGSGSIGPSFSDFTYWPLWREFYDSMVAAHAQKALLHQATCFHCHTSLQELPCGRSMEEMVRLGVIQCTLCNKRSCREWRHTITCPEIQQCPQCLEWCCSSCCELDYCNSCDTVACLICNPNQFVCQICSKNSCSECNAIFPCKQCDETCCRECDNYQSCTRCNASFCGSCIDPNRLRECRLCDEKFCDVCVGEIANSRLFCDRCDFQCEQCLDSKGAVVVECHACKGSYCTECTKLCSTCGFSFCHHIIRNHWDGHSCEARQA